jgi:hypothetical protein
VREHHIEVEIESDCQLLETEREALIVARRGYRVFKQRCRSKAVAESLAL